MLSTHYVAFACRCSLILRLKSLSNLHPARLGYIQCEIDDPEPDTDVEVDLNCSDILYKNILPRLGIVFRFSSFV
jgi:hypothetical protein